MSIPCLRKMTQEGEKSVRVSPPPPPPLMSDLFQGWHGTRHGTLIFFFFLLRKGGGGSVGVMRTPLENTAIPSSLAVLSWNSGRN